MEFKLQDVYDGDILLVVNPIMLRKSNGENTEKNGTTTATGYIYEYYDPVQKPTEPPYKEVLENLRENDGKITLGK